MIRLKKVIDRWGWDWLLIVGAVLAPMTGLRIWKIGPAESLCFIWALRHIRIGKIAIDDYLRFFIPFLLSMLVGTFICIAGYPQELVANGWATWLYLSFIACILYNALSHNSREYNEIVFETICRLSVIWYGLLYVYSIVISRTFLGAPLWYYARYSGGGTNPHQVAVLLCGVAFWFTRQILKRNRVLINLVFFLLAVFLESESKSSTGAASIFLGIFILAVLFTIIHVRSTKIRKTVIIFEILIGLLIGVAFSNAIYNMVYEWVASDANGIGRFYIWSSFSQMIKKSPIFGLGPGMHAISYSGMKEFHNSYLEIIAATGLVGFIAFILFSYRAIRSLLKGDYCLLPILVSIYVYSMAGFAFRRLAFWIVISFVIVLAILVIQTKLGH